MAHSANAPIVQIEELRVLLDANGVLRDGALLSPSRQASYTVLSQRTDARIELASWQRHAEQFFDTRLGLGDDKRYPEGFPTVDAAMVVVALKDGPQGMRLCYGRPRADDDLRAAEDADVRGGSAGLGLLARRCPTAWLVVTRSAPDPTALLVAAILASVVLGPILSPDQEELFGVRTARTKLEKMAPPYR